MKKKWIPPESQPLNPEPEEKPVELQLGERDKTADQVIADMMSGKSFDPYRAQTQEAMARAEANKRAQSAGAIARSGQVGQGMAGQISGGTEQDILSNRFDTMLNTKMAEEQMKRTGVGMYEQGRMSEAGIAGQRAGIELQGKSLAEQKSAREQSALLAASELQSRERMSQQQLQSQESMARAGRYQQSEQFKLSIDEQRLAREAQQKLDQGRLDLSREEQAALDKFRTGQLELGKQEQTYKEKYGDREQMLAEKRADTERLRQISDEFYQRGQIDLGFGKLNFDKMSFEQQHRLQEKAQEWLQKYQQGTLSMDKLKLEIQKEYLEIEKNKPLKSPQDELLEYKLWQEKQKDKNQPMFIRDENTGQWVYNPDYVG